jgi:hypothetical protein
LSRQGFSGGGGPAMLRGAGKFDQIQVNSSKFSPQILNFITPIGKIARLRQPGDLPCQCRKSPEKESRVKPVKTAGFCGFRSN